MADVPLLIFSEYAQSERRITPSWSISQLKAKLETVTGIPPSFQRLTLKRVASEAISIEAANEDDTHLSTFPLVPYAELHVSRRRFFICPALSLLQLPRARAEGGCSFMVDENFSPTHGILLFSSIMDA